MVKRPKKKRLKIGGKMPKKKRNFGWNLGGFASGFWVEKGTFWVSRWVFLGEFWVYFFFFCCVLFDQPLPFVCCRCEKIKKQRKVKNSAAVLGSKKAEKGKKNSGKFRKCKKIHEKFRVLKKKNLKHSKNLKMQKKFKANSRQILNIKKN